MTKITPAARAKLRQLKLKARLDLALMRGLDEYVREGQERRRDLLGALSLKDREVLGIDTSDPAPGLRRLRASNARLFGDLGLTEQLVSDIEEIQACIALGQTERERIGREASAATELVCNLEQWVKSHGG